MRRIIYQGSEAYADTLGVLRTLYKWDFDPFAIELVEAGNKTEVFVQRSINHIWEPADVQEA